MLNYIQKNIELSKIPFKELSFGAKLNQISFFFFTAISFQIIMKVMNNHQDRLTEEKREKHRIKFFKPTIEQTVLGGTKISWTMRDVPLSDEQVNDFFNSRKSVIN
jgi:hypothetical protein